MTEAIVTVRKWGNSIGSTFPEKIVKKEKIRPNDKVVISVKKIVPIKELFGTFKTNKSTQTIKDAAREGWD
jgi:antitoxin component of MazEF toxin-antitoxin module